MAILHICALLFTAGCATCHTTAPPTVVVPPANTPQHPLATGVPGVGNFGFISADVWRGARPTQEGLATLAQMGAKTIINLEQDHDDQPPAGVQYVHLPTSSIHCDQVDIPALLNAIRDNPKPVFIHCHSGVDRTGLAVAAYRLDQGMSAAQAIDELHNFHVHFWWQPFIERRIAQLQQEREDGHQPPSRTIHANSLPAL